MIEKVLSLKNIRSACKQIMSNQGSAGVDGMSAKAMPQYLQENLKRITTAIHKGSYVPQSILGVEIPKGNGKSRLLGIPTVVDRLLQQVVHQIVVSEKKWRTFKQELKLITTKTAARTFSERLAKLKVLYRGWINYFRMASMQAKLKEFDGWLRATCCYFLIRSHKPK